MIKTILLVFLCHLLSFNVASAGQNCYTCIGDTCGANEFVDCANNQNDSTNGKSLVNGALGLNDLSNSYSKVEGNYKTYAEIITGLNSTTTPAWENITRWVCYVSKAKQHGCLIMGKGLCKPERGWLQQLSDVAQKVTDIMKQVGDGVKSMFTGNSINIANEQKQNLSHWMASEYLAKLVDNKAGADHQLDYCCEGDKCNNNFASMGPKSTVMFVVVFPLLLALV